jgi:ATP-dependent exoDNAse (exonuclease V) beta subunit
MRNFIHHELPKIKRSTTPEGIRVYSTPSGNAYPSVTTVTGLHSAKQIAEWRARVGNAEANRISTRASTRGTRIHSYCEDYLRGNIFEADIFDREMFNSVKPLLDRIDNIHCLEDPLYSDHLQVAGTVDCIAEFDGKLSIIDFKTSSRVKSRDSIHGYFMQTAAYAVAFEERTKIPVGRLVVLMAVEDESPLIFQEKRDDWIGEFVNLRKHYKNKFGL